VLLAIETSCDETSAAIVHEGRVLAQVISSQIQLHAGYGGVVPELAAREHLRNLPPVVRTALDEAGVTPAGLNGIAATLGPGLPQALLIGGTCAQGLAFVLRKPFYGIHHHEAHLHSPWITGDPPRADFNAFRPSVSLIVSGGHTMLVHVESELRHRLLGSTVDDAAGECFDKVAKIVMPSFTLYLEPPLAYHVFVRHGGRTLPPRRSRRAPLDGGTHLTPADAPPARQRFVLA
jgi:N6-L-threonylcarbamoyladenine synthase